MKILLYLRRALLRLRSFVGGTVALVAFMAFHWSMALFAVVLIATAVYPVAHAQTPEVRELSRRVAAIENLDISAQLATIRQQLLDMGDAEKKRDADWKPIGTAIAAGALVLERTVKALSAKVRESDA